MHVRSDGQGSRQQTPCKGRAGQRQPLAPGLRRPVPRRAANTAGVSQAERRSAPVVMQEGFSQLLTCRRVMPQWWGGMLHLPDRTGGPCAARAPRRQREDGRFLPPTFILSLKMSLLPFTLLLFYSQAPLVDL